MASIRKVSAFLKFDTIQDERDGLSLDEFIEKHQIVWVLTQQGHPLFVMSDLAEIKGNNPKDYRNSIQRFIDSENEDLKNRNLKDSDFSRPYPTSPDIQVCTSGAPGMAYKFKGDSLKEFKRIYLEQTNQTLKGYNHWIGDWRRAYWYLCIGRSETAIDASNMGAESIRRENIQLAAELSVQEREALVDLEPATPELILQQELLTLSNYCDWKFIAELSVQRPDGKELARFDLVREIDDATVYIYELKKSVITPGVAMGVIANRHYLEAAALRWPDRRFEFIFVSPVPLSQETETMFQVIGAQDFVTRNISGINVTFKFCYQRVQSLALEILARVVEYRSTDYYYLQQNILPKVRHILQSRDALLVIQRVLSEEEE
jgi:hypothetical protein